MRGTLAESGFRVVEAADGRQGLSLAIELQPQVMLVDLAAAEIDGIELTRTLRELVPCVAGSASPSCAARCSCPVAALHR